jgi:hypothetical protein
MLGLPKHLYCIHWGPNPSGVVEVLRQAQHGVLL